MRDHAEPEGRLRMRVGDSRHHRAVHRLLVGGGRLGGGSDDAGLPSGMGVVVALVAGRRPAGGDGRSSEWGKEGALSGDNGGLRAIYKQKKLIRRRERQLTYQV